MAKSGVWRDNFLNFQRMKLPILSSLDDNCALYDVHCYLFKSFFYGCENWLHVFRL